MIVREDHRRRVESQRFLDDLERIYTEAPSTMPRNIQVQSIRRWMLRIEKQNRKDFALEASQFDTQVLFSKRSVQALMGRTRQGAKQDGCYALRGAARRPD